MAGYIFNIILILSVVTASFTAYQGVHLLAVLDSLDRDFTTLDLVMPIAAGISNIQIPPFSPQYISLGGLAPPPGSTVEGTSTAGWTDDGSIVRLNTAADNVGIGTANPAMKLQVQGAAYITGNLNVSGGTFNFSQGTATSTFTILSNGFIGIASTSPASFLSLQGGLFATGTSTMGTLWATSSVVTPRLQAGTAGPVYALPTTDGTSGQVIQTNGAGTLSFVGQNTEWTMLGEQILGAANATATVTFTPTATTTDLTATLELPGFNTTNETLRLTFNLDYSGTSTNYAYRQYEAYKDLGGDDSNVRGILLGIGTTTPTAVSYYFTFTISNTASNYKLAKWEGVASTTGATRFPLYLYSGIGSWTNNTARISTINFSVVNNPSANTMNAGTRLRVYGRGN